MNIVDLIREFCEKNADKYYVHENYSGRGMFGRKCLGIVAKQGNSVMTMMFELARFLETYAEVINGTPFENMAYDDLGLDTIVYFPCIADDEGKN